MKATTTLIALAILAATPALADDMKNMPRMAMKAAKTGAGAGIVTAIDSKAGTVTIQHGPIPAVSWPAMTMTFKAATPNVIRGVKVGEKIGFDVKITGTQNEVTAIRPK